MTGSAFKKMDIFDVKKFTDKMIAVVHRNDDVEDKWIVAPAGMAFT